MRFTRSLALLSAALPLALADIKFTKPTRSTTYTAGETVEIDWTDSGSGPTLNDFASFTMWLCVGSNANPHCDHTIGTVGSVFAPGMTSTRVTIDPTYGENIKNVYFIKMESIAKTAGSSVTYTPRFSMEGMTGDFTADQLTAQKVGDEDPPAPENKVVDPATVTGAAAVAQSDYVKLPYTLQTGPTLYAPMQIQPGKSITATSAKRQYPTSAYTLFTTAGPKPNKEVTVTLPWDYTIDSKVNTASPAPMPDATEEAMQRFLNRWKD